MPLYQDSIIDVKKAETIDDFKIFNNICFDKTLSSENLINLYRKDMIRCYIGYNSEKPVSVTMVLKNKNIHYLEMTSTIPEYRKMGFATIVCQTAIKDSFKEEAELVTIRAGGGPAADDGSKNLGKKLGFKYI